MASLPPKLLATADRTRERRSATSALCQCRCQNHRPCCQSLACAWQLHFRDCFVGSTLKTTIAVFLRLPRNDFGAAFFCRLTTAIRDPAKTLGFGAVA